MEFRRVKRSPLILLPGDILVLPPDTPCRAHRWPRSARKATVYLAVYRRPLTRSSHTSR